MVAAAEDLATANGWHLSFAIVDHSGHLVLMHRMDNASLASINIACQKARSALYYQTATRNLEQGVAAGKTGLLALPDIVAFEGGVPVVVNGQLVGAVGASGGAGHEDGAAAMAAREKVLGSTTAE